MAAKSWQKPEVGIFFSFYEFGLVNIRYFSSL